MHTGENNTVYVIWLGNALGVGLKMGTRTSALHLFSLLKGCKVFIKVFISKRLLNLVVPCWIFSIVPAPTFAIKQAKRFKENNELLNNENVFYFCSTLPRGSMNKWM